MSALNKVSRRELWLVSLLPAVLLVIASSVVPTPAEDIPAIEERLERLEEGASPAHMHSRVQEARADIEESEQSLEELASREAELLGKIQEARKPEAAASPAVASLAEEIDELRVRLASHGVQVLAIDRDGAAGAVRQGVGQSAKSASTNSWRISAMGRWAAVRSALADAQTFSEGLTLLSINMEEASSTTPLRRWEFVVAPQGGRP